MGNSLQSAQFLMESRYSDAAKGDAQACYDLGIAHSCGTGGVSVDLIEAHKWFNLAALAGSEEGQILRAEMADDMTAREVIEAQKRARAWLVMTGMMTTQRHAA